MGEKKDNSGTGGMITVPKKVLEEYVQQIHTYVKKVGEDLDGQRKELDRQKTELKEFMARPFKEHLGGFDEEIDKRVTDKLTDARTDVLIAGKVPEYLAKILPEEIKRQGKFIADLTRTEVEKQAPVIVERVVDKANLGQKVADAINRIDGVQPAGIEETIVRRQKEKARRRTRNRILGGVGGIIVAGSLFLGGWAAYDSSKRTAEGAAGTANDALRISKKADSTAKGIRDDMDRNQKENLNWHASHDAVKKKEDEEKRKEISGLETRLGERIDSKTNKTDFDGLMNKYTTLDTLLRTEIAKYDEREKAYTDYKTLADKTKSDLDKLREDFGGLEAKAATKEYADTELGKIRTNIAEKIQTRIDEYGRHIKQLQDERGGYDDKIKRINQDYEALKKDYEELKKKLTPETKVEPKSEEEKQP